MNPIKQAPEFLQGGGETGELLRHIDWASTSLGEPTEWPLQLKIAIKAMLHTPLPTYICWGKDYIQFYNDAFIPSFGSTRHPKALGKPAKDMAQMWSLSGPIFEKVMNGENVQLKDFKTSLDKNGFIEDCYMDIFYSPMYLDDWSIGGVHLVVIETTNKVKALLKSKEDEFKIRSLIEKSSSAICLFVGKEMKIDIANDKMVKLWGKTAQVVGMSLAEAVPELTNQSFLQLLDNVFTSGVTMESKSMPADLEVDGHLQTFYFDFSYIAIRNAAGEIYGVMDIATDVTQEVITRKALENSKKQLDFTIQAAELGTWNLNPETFKFTGNSRLKEWFGLSPEEEIDLHLATDVIIEKDKEAVNTAIKNALTFSSGGNYEIDYTIINPKTNQEIIVKAKGKAIFDEHQKPYNFSGTLQDITAEATIKKQLAKEVLEQLNAKTKLEESELFSHNIFYNSPVAKLVFTGLEMTIARVNENMLSMLGRDTSIIGKPFAEALPELLETPLLDKMKGVFTTGITFIQPEEKIDIIRFGQPYTGYYNYIYKPLISTSGEIYGIIVTATEFTEQVMARKQIEEKEKELRDLIIAAPIGICVVSGKPVRVNEVNDRFLLIAGKTRREFEQAPYWEVMHEIAGMFETILDNVFKTGIKFRSEEHEMVLIRSGIKEKIFATFEYIPVIDNDNTVTRVIILAIEVTHQVETRKQIEAAVIERTKELDESNLNLKRSNAELEQFAYIASHDLQEPVRKISTFTQLLEHSIPDMPDQAKSYLSKIYNSTDRMNKLIRDVLAFSQISAKSDGFETVDLFHILQNVTADFEVAIADTGAQIKVEHLPHVEAIPSQMTQLFGNLMSNALKYIRPGIVPVIEIKSSIAKKEKVRLHPQLDSSRNYYHIIFSDNGIGFEQEHADRIFKIFQRLHGKTEFEGTGIGLSICRKIVQTHHGHISAQLGDNGGAVFNILLPAIAKR